MSDHRPERCHIRLPVPLDPHAPAPCVVVRVDAEGRETMTPCEFIPVRCLLAMGQGAAQLAAVTGRGKGEGT